MGRPAVRDGEGLLRAHERRIKLLERRVTKTPLGLPVRLAADAFELTTENLNDLTDSGWYAQTKTANVSEARNYPPGSRAGMLEVVKTTSGDGFVMQRYTDYQFSAPGSITRFIWVRNFYNGGWYPWRRIGNQSRGPSGSKPAAPQYWEFYYETDTRNMMVADKSGNWRRYAGRATHATTAWSNVNGTTMAGRTNVFTLPTTLEPDETLMVQIDPAVTTSGFNFIGVTGLVRNPANTQVNVRLMQLFSTTTQPMPIVWQIVPAP